MKDLTYYNTLKEEIRKERIGMHNEIKQTKLGKHLFMFMNVCVALLILFNIGALVITNALVYKTNPDTELREVNPIASDVHGFEEHPEAKSLYVMFIVQMIFYILIIISYFLMWHGIYLRQQLIVCSAIIFGIMMISAYDFFNDFGYYIGKLIWGV